jgi:putative aldouronate transport system permease protein
LSEKVSKQDRLFHLLNNGFILLISLTMVAPIIHVAAVSFSSAEFAQRNLVTFWPKGFNLEVYEKILDMDQLWRSFGVTVYTTVVGTLLALMLTSSIAYSLSRPNMPFKKIILQLILITFVFTAPLIPNYLLVKSLGLENTLWALMLPPALSAFNVIIMKTFFQGLSEEVFDSAKIDGCSEFGIFTRIALPMSKPVIATIGLFQAVALWNSYFSALIYIRSEELFPLQLLLRTLIIEEAGTGSEMSSTNLELTFLTPEQMKAGIILFATVPILILYPFLQKYFVKGAMLGSLKE